MTGTGDLVTAASGAVIGAPPPAFAPRLWHGFTPALAMSAFAIMVGAIMLRHYRRLLSLWDRLPLPEARALYEQGVGAAVGWGRTAPLAIHHSSLQRQLALLFALALQTGRESGRE